MNNKIKFKKIKTINYKNLLVKQIILINLKNF